MAVPSKPILSVTAITETTVTVSWPTPANNGSPITGYNLYAGAPPSYPPATPDTVPAGSNHATFTGLTPGAIVYLLVAAENEDGPSTSGQVVVRTGSGTTTGSVIGDGYGDPKAGGLCVNYDEPTLQIGPVSLASRSIWCFDTFDALLGSDLIGDLGAMPDYPGTFPNEQRQTATTYSFPILVDSQVNPLTGLDYTGLTPTRAFLRTLAYIRNYLIDPTTARTLPAYLFHPDGYVLEKPCQVQRLVKGGRIEAVNEAGVMTMSMSGELKVRFPFGGFNLQ